MILELLRQKIHTCGKSRYQLSNETRIDKATLCRLVHGGSCKVETAEKLLDYFGYKVVKTSKTR